MVEVELFSRLAEMLRSTKSDEAYIFTISSNQLITLTNACEPLEDEGRRMSSSFHLGHASNAPPERLKEQTRDLHFLHHSVQNLQQLKIYTNELESIPIVDITQFKNLQTLDLYRVPIKCVKGLQKLRPRLQRISCYGSILSLSEILIGCGADNSNEYCWNQIKEAKFNKCTLVEIDASIEFAPLLHTLDLSYNSIHDLAPLNQLTNLKYLNVSYNKLEKLCEFRGPICSRLQHLILRQNFIEDISGLQVLSNLYVLDLACNWIVDHSNLAALSHSITLQLLNLVDNPIYFHPQHRRRTSMYLHRNLAATQFCLDNKVLRKGEKKLLGTLHPTRIRNIRNQGSGAVHGVPGREAMGASNSSDGLNTMERSKRVRQVEIEDEVNPSGVSSVKKTSSSPIISSQLHLETKRQIESLREQYGESWLKSNAGVHNVLGLESSITIMQNSNPYEREFLLHSADFQRPTVKKDFQTNSLRVEDLKLKSDDSYLYDTTDKANYKCDNNEESIVSSQRCESFNTALDTSSDITMSVDNEKSNSGEESSETSDVEDYELGGEENMFVVKQKGDQNDEHLFLVITKTHIYERETTKGVERARWHLNSISACRVLESENGERKHKKGNNDEDEEPLHNMVQLDFETMRRDKKQRVYVFIDVDELPTFVDLIEKKLATKMPVKVDSIHYQCMKCSTTFEFFLSTDSMGVKHIDKKSLKCPKCSSTLIVEI